MLKVIVAERYTFHDYNYEYLAKELDIRIPPFIEETASRDAEELDKMGIKWTKEHGYPVKHF